MNSNGGVSAKSKEGEACKKTLRTHPHFVHALSLIATCGDQVRLRVEVDSEDGLPPVPRCLGGDDLHLRFKQEFGRQDAKF